MIESVPPKEPPYWLWKTKRLFSHPIFAGGVSVVCLFFTIGSAGMAIGARLWPLGIVSLLFLSATYATSAAAISLMKARRSQVEPQQGKSMKPTFAVLVLLTSLLSWQLMVAMHIFRAFFKNGPGSFKYYVTLSIAVATSLFMQIYGKQIVRQYFEARERGNVVLSPRQALYVVVYMLCFGIYFTWVLS